MKFILISIKTHEALDKHEASTIEEAKSYFVGIKRMAIEEFDKLWEVITDEAYESRQRAEEVKRLYEPGDGEFGSWLDMEKS